MDTPPVIQAPVASLPETQPPRLPFPAPAIPENLVPPVLPEDTVPLKSEKGVDYRKLRDLLEAKDWKAADNETYRRMLEAVGRKEGDWIRQEELLNFPCADLKTIDGLWVHYSDGHFGFSVQKKIYLECGGKPDGKYPGDKIWEKFGDRVGWRVNKLWIGYDDVSFNTQAPEGHLPAQSVGGGGLMIFIMWGGGDGMWFSSLASRLVKCKE